VILEQLGQSHKTNIDCTVTGNIHSPTIPKYFWCLVGEVQNPYLGMAQHIETNHEPYELPYPTARQSQSQHTL